MKADFKKRYGGGKADTAAAKSLNKEFGYVHLWKYIKHCTQRKSLSRFMFYFLLWVLYFKVRLYAPYFRPIMKEHMKYIIDHAEEIEKLIKVKAQVSEVKSIMLGNIDKVNEKKKKNSF